MKRLCLFAIGCLVVFVAVNLTGCRDDCSIINLGPGQEYDCGIDTRSYLLYAPGSYDPSAPAALVVDMHGMGSNAEQQAGLEDYETPEGIVYSGMGSGYRMVADREGFVVATPQCKGQLWTQTDLDFLDEVVAEIKNAADIDRVYITGISNGGQITYWAGCQQDDDTYQGLSAASSNLKNESCESIFRPAPLIAFHSPDDQTIDPEQGYDAALAWALANGCYPVDPHPSMTFGGPGAGPEPVCYRESNGEFELVSCDVNDPATACVTWDRCDNGVEVVFCTVPPDPGTTGHILYRNGTKLSLAAVAWEFWDRF